MCYRFSPCFSLFIIFAYLCQVYIPVTLYHIFGIKSFQVKLDLKAFTCVLFQEDLNRGKPNWEHLNDDLHVLITVEDSENRANMKLQRAVEEVKKLLVVVGAFKFKGKQCVCISIVALFDAVRRGGRAQEATVDGTRHNQWNLQGFSVKNLIT